MNTGNYAAVNVALGACMLAAALVCAACSDGAKPPVPKQESACQAVEHAGHDHGPVDAVHAEQHDAGEHAGHTDCPDNHAAPAEEHAGHADEKDGHTHAAAGSDLDRSIDEMWAAKCEHDILHYTCDECRYELGVVKLQPDIFGSQALPGLVSATVAQTGSLPRSVALTGEVKAYENSTTAISSAVNGAVRSTPVSSGRQVDRGAVLLEIDSPDIAEAQGAFRQMLIGRELAAKNLQREERLFEKMVSAQVDVETARAQLAQAVIECANARSKLLNLGHSEGDIAALETTPLEKISGRLVVRAPHKGIVLERYVNNGERIDPGTSLLLLSDLSRVAVWADLKEDDLILLNGSRDRAAVEVEAPSSPGTVYAGVIDGISGSMREQTRTARARIVLDNAGAALKPGMFVTIRLLLPAGGDTVIVPTGAVLADAGRTFVFVHKQGDYWIRRPVTLGASMNGTVAVLDGLAAGQTVIADGSFLLKSDVLRSKMGAGCAD